MVHKKYTYKDGKRFGPYYYETKRVDGKVVTTYLGIELPKINNKNSSPTNVNWKLLLPLIVIAAILLLLFLPIDFTGKATLDIKTNYRMGEQIDGALTFNLKEGELVPSNSKVLINYGNYSKEFLLSSLVSDGLVSGDFYAEGVSLSGSGEGYGLIGSKTIYPEISFSLKLSMDTSSSEVASLGEIVSEGSDVSDSNNILESD